MHTLIINYIASVAGTATILAIGYISIKKIRNFFKVASAATNLGIVDIKQAETSEDLSQMVKHAQENLWLICLSGCHEIDATFQKIIRWCKKPRSQKLVFCALNPENGPLLEAVAKTIDQDREELEKNIRASLNNFSKAKGGGYSLSKDEGNKIDIRIYDSAPASSIVAADPRDEKKGYLFVEHYLHSKRWAERCCLKLSAAHGGGLYRSYLESLNALLSDEGSRPYKSQ